jgi:hypothetical protein
MSFPLDPNWRGNLVALSLLPVMAVAFVAGFVGCAVSESWETGRNAYKKFIGEFLK